MMQLSIKLLNQLTPFSIDIFLRSYAKPSLFSCNPKSKIATSIFKFVEVIFEKSSSVFYLRLRERIYRISSEMLTPLIKPVKLMTHHNPGTHMARNGTTAMIARTKTYRRIRNRWKLFTLSSAVCV
jgi:hypothetical protein